jgi:hypothetical protein
MYSQYFFLFQLKCRLQAAATCSRWFLARASFYIEDGGDTFLRNVGSHEICSAPFFNFSFGPQFFYVTSASSEPQI